MAKCFSALGRKSDATRTYTQILEVDPKNAAALRETAELRQVEQFKNQAKMAAENGSFNSAISFLVRPTPPDDAHAGQAAGDIAVARVQGIMGCSKVGSGRLMCLQGTPR